MLKASHMDVVLKLKNKYGTDTAAYLWYSTSMLRTLNTNANI